MLIGLALAPYDLAAGGGVNPSNSGVDRPSLDELRQRTQDWVAALKETDPGAKVDRLDSFLRKYPDWEGRPQALQLLATALLESGTPDLRRVEALLDEISRAPKVNCNTLNSVLQTYVAHPELPMAGAQRAIQRAEAMFAQDRRETDAVDSKARRMEGKATIERCEQSFEALQGKLLLVRGNAAGALPILKEAELKGVRLGIDLVSMDERGRTGGPFPTGRLDELRLSLGMAYETTGDRASARQELSRVVGSRLGESDREVARTLRARLGVELPPAVEVKSPLSRAPELALADLSGRKHRLSDYRGRVIALAFWSTT